MKVSKKELDQLTNRFHKALEKLERRESQFFEALAKVQTASEEILGFADDCLDEVVN